MTLAVPGDGGKQRSAGALLSDQSNTSFPGEVTSSLPERSENANQTHP